MYRIMGYNGVHWGSVGAGWLGVCGMSFMEERAAVCAQ